MTSAERRKVMADEKLSVELVPGLGENLYRLRGILEREGYELESIALRCAGKLQGALVGCVRIEQTAQSSPGGAVVGEVERLRAENARLGSVIELAMQENERLRAIVTQNERDWAALRTENTDLRAQVATLQESCKLWEEQNAEQVTRILEQSNQIERMAQADSDVRFLFQAEQRIAELERELAVADARACELQGKWLTASEVAEDFSERFNAKVGEALRLERELAEALGTQPIAVSCVDATGAVREIKLYAGTRPGEYAVSFDPPLQLGEDARVTLEPMPTFSKPVTFTPGSKP